jgi:hypothetical protein
MVEKKYIASMLSEGNHVFQPSIKICEDGVKLKIPKFWKNKETFFRYQDISGFSLNTPRWYSILSYCTISFNAKGTWVEVHGFTKSDALKIKKHIKEGQSSSSISKNLNSSNITKRQSYEEWRQKSRQEDNEFRTYLRKLGEEHRQKEEHAKNEYYRLLNELKLLLVTQYGLLYFQKETSNDEEYKDTQFNLENSKKNLIKILRKLDKESSFEEIIFECKNAGFAMAKEDISDANNKRKSYIENIVADVFQKSDNEMKSEEYRQNIPSCENFQFPVNKIKSKKKIRLLTREFIDTYGQIDIEYLIDHDNIEENRHIARKLIKSVLKKNGREVFTNYIDNLEHDVNHYTDLSKKLVNLIFDIFESGVTRMENETGILEFPFALDSEKIREFLRNTEYNLRDRLNKIIYSTDNLIDRFEQKQFD